MTNDDALLCTGLATFWPNVRGGSDLSDCPQESLHLLFGRPASAWLMMPGPYTYEVVARDRRKRYSYSHYVVGNRLRSGTRRRKLVRGIPRLNPSLDVLQRNPFASIELLQATTNGFPLVLAILLGPLGGSA